MVRVNKSTQKKEVNTMNKLEELRRKADLTQATLASKSGVSLSTISRLEISGLNDAKVETLLKLAEAIGCRIEDFFMP